NDNFRNLVSSKIQANGVGIFQALFTLGTLFTSTADVIAAFVLFIKLIKRMTVSSSNETSGLHIIAFFACNSFTAYFIPKLFPYPYPPFFEVDIILIRETFLYNSYNSLNELSDEWLSTINT